MGHQILFHMLSEDLKDFIRFVRNRDPVVVTLKSTDEAKIEDIREPETESRTMVLWNQALLGMLERKHINAVPSAFRIRDDSPVIELSPSVLTEWRGSPALMQGRLYIFGDHSNPELLRWYNSLSRWIRTRCSYEKASPVPGYIGQSAREWFVTGGILLPMFVPAETAEWNKAIERQHPSNLIT